MRNFLSLASIYIASNNRRGVPRGHVLPLVHVISAVRALGGPLDLVHVLQMKHFVARGVFGQRIAVRLVHITQADRIVARATLLRKRRRRRRGDRLRAWIRDAPCRRRGRGGQGGLGWAKTLERFALVWSMDNL